MSLMLDRMVEEEDVLTILHRQVIIIIVSSSLYISELHPTCKFNGMFCTFNTTFSSFRSNRELQVPVSKDFTSLPHCSPLTLRTKIVFFRTPPLSMLKLQHGWPRKSG